jgi:hypothetical protein
VVNALVLATGGFGASKEMLRVRALGMCVGEGGRALTELQCRPSTGTARQPVLLLPLQAAKPAARAW